MKKRIIFALMAVAAMAFDNSSSSRHNSAFLADYEGILKEPFATIPNYSADDMEIPNAAAAGHVIQSMAGADTTIEIMSKSPSGVQYSPIQNVTDGILALSKNDELLGLRFSFDFGSVFRTSLPSHDSESYQKLNKIFSGSYDVLNGYMVSVFDVIGDIEVRNDGNYYSRRTNGQFTMTDSSGNTVLADTNYILSIINDSFVFPALNAIRSIYSTSQLANKSGRNKIKDLILRECFELDNNDNVIFKHPQDQGIKAIQYWLSILPRALSVINSAGQDLISELRRRDAYLRNLAKHASYASKNLDRTNDHFIKANEQYQESRSNIMSKMFENPNYLSLKDNGAMERLANYGTLRYNYSSAGSRKNIVSDDFYNCKDGGASEVACSYIVRDRSESTNSLKSHFSIKNEHQIEIMESMSSDLESLLEEYMTDVDEEKAAEIMKFFKSRSKEILERESTIFEKMEALLDQFFHALHSLMASSSNNDCADADFINQLVDSLSDIIGSISIEGLQDNKEVTMKLKMSPINLNIETISALLTSSGNFEASNNAIKHALSNNYAGQSAPVETKGLFESLKLNKSSFVDFFRSCLSLSTLNGAPKVNTEEARNVIINEGRYGVSAFECSRMISIKTDPFKKEQKDD